MSKIINFINKNSIAELEKFVTVKTVGEYKIIWSTHIDLKQEFLQEQLECNGTIITSDEKDVYKIICLGINRSVDYYDYFKIHKKDSVDIKDFTIEPCVDGSLVRLWYNHTLNKWQISTTKKMNAEEAFWSSKKNIAELFREACPYLMYDKLNKDYCYSFILRHPEHTQVFSVEAPSVLHVGTRDLVSLDELELKNENSRVSWNVSGGESKNVSIPQEYTHLKSFDEIEEFTKTLYSEYRGIILKHKNNSLRLKLDTDLFKDMSETRGNVPHLKYRYLKLLNDPYQLEKLKSYYPNYNHVFNAIEDEILKVSEYIQNLYFNVYVLKDTSYTKVEDYNVYEKTLKQLHGQFKSSCRNGKRTDTSVSIVQQKLKSLNQYLLAQHLKWWN